MINNKSTFLIGFLANSIGKYLFRLYAINSNILRRVILKMVIKLEGGQVYSKTLRRIFAAYHNIKIGMYTYGSCFSIENIPVGTEIGRYCSFAQNVRIFNGNHPMENKSTHPFFYNPTLKYVSKEMITRTKLVIGNDVWIGFNVIVLPSVASIGDGAIIGAGSVVTKDVPPFTVVVGNPAKIIKKRFANETIQNILKSPWWNKTIEELSVDVEEFMWPLEGRRSEFK